MIDTIYIAMTGLRGYEKGLQVIANDSANLNTPGFKSSTLQFADMFYGAGNLSGGGGQGAGQLGYGLNTLGTTLNFKQGQFQSTGNNLDLAVDGSGLFVLKGENGNIHYTRDGQFKFNADGVLISSTTGEQVMAQNGDGNLAAISIASVKNHAAQATTTVKFGGNVLSTATTQTIGNITVIDKSGSTNALSVKLDAVSGTPGTWTVTLLDGTTVIGSGSISFVNGEIVPANSKVSVSYTPSGQAMIPLTLDFSNDVTSNNLGAQSTLTRASQDGYSQGVLSATSFDTTGTLVMTYSNGQTVKGGRLALGRFNVADAIKSVGNNEYQATDERAWDKGVAGTNGFGNIRTGMIEMSNVDLSREFSNLVIMQRGYQASSQVVSTANDMLSELFAMKGK